MKIEGKFDQGKEGYRLSYIRAKRANTSLAWINSIFLVMNLLVLYRVFIGFCKSVAVTAIIQVWNTFKQILRTYGRMYYLASDHGRLNMA